MSISPGPPHKNTDNAFCKIFFKYFIKVIYIVFLGGVQTRAHAVIWPLTYRDPSAFASQVLGSKCGPPYTALFIHWFILCVLVFCLHVCIYGTEEGIRPLELELVFMNCRVAQQPLSIFCVSWGPPHCFLR